MENIQDNTKGAEMDAIVKRWEKVLDYSDETVPEIQNEHVYRSTARLLENQRSYLNESNSSGGVFGAASAGGNGIANGDNYAAGDQRLPQILIPMIRRTFPELVANEICGVQPMGGPVGLAFAMRFAYQNETLGTGIDGKTPPLETQAGANSPNGGVNPALSGAGNLPASELGYQYLDSRFTGTSSGFLSGNADWTFADEDTGIAALLGDYELSGDIPQVELKFEKTSVTAGTRRLGTRWSIELEQDIKNMNGIDLDAELTNAMSYEIQAEIDREVVMRMIQSAINGGINTGYSFWSPVSSDGRWTAERNHTFFQKLMVESGRLAARNRRGPANFVVATPRVCTILELLPDFETFKVNGNVTTNSVGITKVGTVGSRFTVYRDTRTEVQDSTYYKPNYYNNAPATKIEYALLGYKGAEYYDTGIIYCPYIPLMVQRTIGPNDFAPRVGMLTRYGIVSNIFGSDLYYHLVLVKNLGEAFTPGTVSVYL
jgi:hypothetical protein